MARTISVSGLRVFGSDIRAGPHSFSVAAMLRLMSVTHALRFALLAGLPVNEHVFSFSIDYDQKQIRSLVNRTSVRWSELGITTLCHHFKRDERISR